MIHGDIKNSTTLRHLNSVHTEGYSDNSLWSCDALHENGHKTGQYLSCGRFHSFNSCKFRNSGCFKCGDIGHIQSVCNTTAHLAATNIKSCNSDSVNCSVPKDHLSLSTISKDSVESYNSSELGETHNFCETTVSNQSTYQISHVIVPDMVFPNDSLISDEISYKSEENMLSEYNYDQKPDETISEESNLDVLSNIICPDNSFVSCGKLVQCEAQVLNELEFDYNLDDFIPTAVYPYYIVTSSVYYNQCEKYVLNEGPLFITWGYEDPKLFRGRV
ncbi:unnamed protein product [Schistosoma haematobium]|nr:unnamed protein product [Schistosoma haematobium]